MGIPALRTEGLSSPTAMSSPSTTWTSSRHRLLALALLDIYSHRLMTAAAAAAAGLTAPGS